MAGFAPQPFVQALYASATSTSPACEAMSALSSLRKKAPLLKVRLRTACPHAFEMLQTSFDLYSAVGWCYSAVATSPVIHLQQLQCLGSSWTAVLLWQALSRHELYLCFALHSLYMIEVS
jgi:hypothetical protein